MSLSIEAIMENFSQFWARFFPEMAQMTREEALRFAGDSQHGMHSHLPDKKMVPYQDRVAKVYGAYEDMQFQLMTFFHLVTNIRFKDDGPLHIVSLASGPGSYELWTLMSINGSTVTLVDHSPEMLARARNIAAELQLSSRLETKVADAAMSGVPSSSAEMVLCINGMHWSGNWRRWISEAARIAKPGAPVFLTCSLGHPRSNIQVEDLAASCAEHFRLIDANLVMPPTMGPNGMPMISSRFYVVAQKPY